jgi:hypothetical protein
MIFLFFSSNLVAGEFKINDIFVFDKQIIILELIMLKYTQTDSVRLDCTIDLTVLFKTVKERDNFDRKWPEFLTADPYNGKVYTLQGDTLCYKSENLIPAKKDSRSPLLLLLGNPASHSVYSRMFFAFEKNEKEHRFWKFILKNAGLDFTSNISSINDRNAERRRQLVNLDYDLPYRVGFSVFFSLPSGASGEHSGVEGIKWLLGVKALRRLENEEKKRFDENISQFMPYGGTVLTFQKNAWNKLKCRDSPEYKRKIVHMVGMMSDLGNRSDIALGVVPSTRYPSLSSLRIISCLNQSKKKKRNFGEFFRWTVIGEVFKALPGEYTLRQDIHGGGQQDCLNICDKYQSMQPVGIFHRNVGMNGIHFTTFPDGFYGNTKNRKYYTFKSQYSSLPRGAEIKNCVKKILEMINDIDTLPENTISCEAYIYLFVGAFLERKLLSDEKWECRGVFVNKSLAADSVYDEMRKFPFVERILQKTQKVSNSKPIQFWVINKNNQPMIGLDMFGRVANQLGKEILLTDIGVEKALAILCQ